MMHKSQEQIRLYNVVVSLTESARWISRKAENQEEPAVPTMATPTRFPIMPGHRSSSTQCTLLIKHDPNYETSRVETNIHFSIFAKIKMFRRFRENNYFSENVP